VSTDLHKQLESLHGELARTNTVDRDSRELLLTLLSDITRLLESQPADRDASLKERLNAAAVKFEAGHPALGAALRRLVDTLGKAGI
jgi:hypothetical protein